MDETAAEGTLDRIEQKIIMLAQIGCGKEKSKLSFLIDEIPSSSQT
jgi:hypothetical protein